MSITDPCPKCGTPLDSERQRPDPDVGLPVGGVATWCPECEYNHFETDSDRREAERESAFERSRGN